MYPKSDIMSLYYKDTQYDYQECSNCARQDAQVIPISHFPDVSKRLKLSLTLNEIP